MLPLLASRFIHVCAVLLPAAHRQHLFDVSAPRHIPIEPVSFRTRFGPVAQYHENSMYYSAVKPKPNPEVDNNLPHITIQLPVYKESLEAVMFVLHPP